MLIDEKLFKTVEEWLRKDGHIRRFEKEAGPIKGRMMITLTDIPEGIEINSHRGEIPVAFEGSFDFYDATVGIALSPKDKKAATCLWVTPQEDGAERPSEKWIEFFIKTLVSHIGEDGSYGIPIYSFVNDTADLTIVPSAPDIDSKKTQGDGSWIEYNCPNCGAILNEQGGFDTARETWKCKECGTILHGDSLDGIRFKGVAWYCDKCGAYLNAQDGFTDIHETWKCKECGYENMLSADEIIDSDLMFGSPEVH